MTTLGLSASQALMQAERAAAASTSALADAPLWLAWLAVPSLASIGIWLTVSALRSRKRRSTRRREANNAAHRPGPERGTDADSTPARSRRALRLRRRRPLGPADERAFEALSRSFGLDRRQRRLVTRLAEAVEAKPVALLMSPDALGRAAALLDDPPRNSGLSALTLEERRRLVSISPDAASGRTGPSVDTLLNGADR